MAIRGKNRLDFQNKKVDLYFQKNLFIQSLLS